MALDHTLHLGSELLPLIEEISALRVRVFRDWPYLYDGDEDQEARYLRGFAEAKDAACIIARDGDRIVGAATSAALEGHDDAFSRPLAEAGYKIADIYYLAESVLLPDYRGQGSGHRFFDGREAVAKERGYGPCVFCAVARDAGDPRAPEGARSLAPFWEGRGYRRIEGVSARYDWREVGGGEEVPHRMDYWINRSPGTAR